MIKITVKNIKPEEAKSFLGLDALPGFGENLTLPCGVQVMNLTPDGNNFFENPIVIFCLEALGSIAINLISSYLYDFMREKFPDKEPENTDVDESAAIVGYLCFAKKKSEESGKALDILINGHPITSNYEDTKRLLESFGK